MTCLEALAAAIETRDSHTVQSLISSGAVDASARLPRRLSPPALVIAVALNAATIVETLVRANARIDDADDKGCTACHAAASNRRADLLAQSRSA